MRKLFVLLVVVLLPACGPVSKNPLSDPDKALPDAQLLGAWRAVPEQEQNKNEYTFGFVGMSGHADAPPGMMKAIIIGNDTQNQIKADEFYLFTTSLNERSFLNYFDKAVFNRERFPAWDKTNIPYFIFMEYTIKDDTLELRVIDSQVVTAAVKNGQLKGIVVKKGNSSVEQITVTASSQELCQYILASKKEVLFPDSGRMVFKRVK